MRELTRSEVIAGVLAEASASAGAKLEARRLDDDGGSLLVRRGDKSVSVDLYWDEDHLVANVMAGTGDRPRPGDTFVRVEDPRADLTAAVLALL